MGWVIAVLILVTLLSWAFTSLGWVIAVLILVTLLSWAFVSLQAGEIREKDAELSSLKSQISSLHEEGRGKEAKLRATIQSLERRRDQLQDELRQSREHVRQLQEHVRQLQEHAAFIEAMQKLALSCNRCGRLAYPITDTGNRYGCLCGNQFPGARHGLPTPRKPPPIHVNFAEDRALEDQR